MHVPYQPAIPRGGRSFLVQTPLHHGDALGELGKRGRGKLAEEAIIPPDAFNEDGSGKQRDATAGNPLGFKKEVFRQLEWRVGDYPIKGLIGIRATNEISDFTIAVVKNVRGCHLLKVLAQRFDHEPAIAGRFQARHALERLWPNDVFKQRPRRPRGRGEVIEARFWLNSLSHDGVRFVLHPFSVARFAILRNRKS